MFEGKLENFKSLYGMKSMLDVFYFLLNDRNGDVYQSESEQHKNLLGKASHAKFICENTRLFKLVEDICSHQRICDSVFVPKALDQNVHTAVINWQCKNNGHVVNWTSSDELGKNFSVNYSSYLEQLCSGMSASQYERFCEFAEIGTVTQHFRDSAAITVSNVIGLITRQSVQNSLAEEISTSGEDGISIMTDARHYCRKNSYHTDHVALGTNTHKVINMQHITRDEERSTQKHEIVGC